jgi:catechol 2,3-dioxygenase-like lactoylglutathione lyase family enzyme
MRARRAPPDTELMDAKVEVITIPVSDVDRALAFYTEQAGFHLDVDYHPASGFRVVQLTPLGSPCTVQVGLGLTDAAHREAPAALVPMAPPPPGHRPHLPLSPTCPHTGMITKCRWSINRQTSMHRSSGRYFP